METWTDPSGNTCDVDVSKWNAKEVALRVGQGWKAPAGTKADVSLVPKDEPKAPKAGK